MKKLVIILLIISFNQVLLAVKPFSSWHLDGSSELHFDEEECLFEIKEDTYPKDRSYLKTDVFTDENNNRLFNFDFHDDKFQIRDTNDKIVFEHVFFVDFSKPEVETIILPYYKDKIVYYAFSQSVDRTGHGSLQFFKIDYSGDSIEANYDKTIQSFVVSINLLTATISKEEERYFIATQGGDPSVLLLIELFPDGDYNYKRYFEFDSINYNVPFPGYDMKFSPQGDKLIVNYDDGLFYFFDFDNATGEATQKFKVDFKKEIGYNIRGSLEFSQDGTKLYLQSGHDKYRIHQFDLNNYSKTAVLSSREEIWSKQMECVDCLFRDFQLAPNNRIYLSYLHSFTGKQDSTFLGVIECPNQKGIAANYKHLDLNISPNKISIPYLNNIPTNFLKTPQTPTKFTRFPDVLEFCENTDAIIKGVDDPCGEHRWKKLLDKDWVYSQDLVLENITSKDELYYVYSFQNCEQIFIDTFEVKIIDSIAPKIVLVEPAELDLCDKAIGEMVFTSDKEYSTYEWSFTPKGSSTRTIISTNDTVIISELGVLELVIRAGLVCIGTDEYIVDVPKLEYGNVVEEYNLKICRGEIEYHSFGYSIKSNVPLRIDSIKFSNSKYKRIINESALVGLYLNGDFDQSTSFEILPFIEESIRDTLVFYIYSNCYYEIKIPIILTSVSNEYILEVPHLLGELGDRNFEIPVFLSTSCVKNSGGDFEATLSFSREKYFIEKTDGLTVLDKWQDVENQYVRIYIDLSNKVKGKTKIGSLFGTLVLTNIDSTGINIIDTLSNTTVILKDGSLVTNDICIQNFRPVNMYIDSDVNFYLDDKILILENGYNNFTNTSVNLLDYTGRKLVSEVDKSRIDLTNISTGVYFLQVRNELNTKTYKIFVE